MMTNFRTILLYVNFHFLMALTMNSGRQWNLRCAHFQTQTQIHNVLTIGGGKNLVCAEYAHNSSSQSPLQRDDIMLHGSFPMTKITDPACPNRPCSPKLQSQPNQAGQWEPISGCDASGTNRTGRWCPNYKFEQPNQKLYNRLLYCHRYLNKTNNFSTLCLFNDILINVATSWFTAIICSSLCSLPSFSFIWSSRHSYDPSIMHTASCKYIFFSWTHSCTSSFLHLVYFQSRWHTKYSSFNMNPTLSDSLKPAPKLPTLPPFHLNTLNIKLPPPLWLFLS